MIYPTGGAAQFGNVPAPQLVRRRVEAVTLSAGTKLGPFEILAPIGAGGMVAIHASAGWHNSFHLT